MSDRRDGGRRGGNLYLIFTESALDIHRLGLYIEVRRLKCSRLPTQGEIAMPRRRQTPLGWGLCIAGFIMIAASCSPGMRAEERPATETKEDTMQLAAKTDLTPAPIPPIDLKAPAAFETAAFGLG
jgi:hypothetical protein